MPTPFAWIFGLLTLGQIVWILMEWWAKKGQHAHLRATRDDVRALLEMCQKAAEGEQAFSGEAERVWAGTSIIRLGLSRTRSGHSWEAHGRPDADVIVCRD